MRNVNVMNLALVAATVAAGCGVTYWDTHSVPGGLLASDGVVIEADAQRPSPVSVAPFTFRAGAHFVTPFEINFCPKPELDKWREATAFGAQYVRVTHPGLPRPLFGVLALCRVHNSATGAASRAYRIQVPQEYVEATTDGRVSVVWEPSGATNDDMRDAASWILWLSREPFVR